MNTPTPAARLTAAAAHLRQLAAAVPPPPWNLGGIGDYGWTVHMGDPTGRFESLDTRMDSPEGKALARYIATMGPGVVITIAEWLEHEARSCRDGRTPPGPALMVAASVLTARDAEGGAA